MYKTKFLFILLLFICFKSLPLYSQDKINFQFLYSDTIMAGNELKLKVNINSREPVSFARLQINLQEGFVPINNNKSSAQFIHSKNIIKWIWISFGEKNEQIIEVTLATNKNIEGSKIFETVFSFADEDSSVHLKLAPINVYILPYVEPIVEAKPKEKIPVVVEKPYKYTIQIIAKREDNPAAVKKYLLQNKVKEKAFSFKENDLYKFCIGKFKELEEAEEYRKKLSEKHNLKDAFVRAIPLEGE